MPEIGALPRIQLRLAAPAALPLVEARQVTRAFQVAGQTVTAVRDVSLQIRAGDRVALLGTSGSGKSTLLHLLGSLDTPTSGSVAWPSLGDGQDLRPGKVAFVFQAQSLIPPLTALENVALPLLLKGDTPGAAQQEAAAWLERLELLPLADHLPEELSGGQAQRVAVARALVTHPRLILADEPTGQLDSATAQHLLDVLLTALDPNAALVMATHDPDVARRLDTIWRMQDGQLVSVTRRQEEAS
ncbi:lipoprotein-releasing system ATP-binding protein LolD [Deinococcus carri]|uniref:Lipoprotein-releasing system ATP-binding protein LolD n=1 Tax=Deinococcus carri TaxID=1211323 RepID=A0ABP9W4W9_9DEIO